MPRIAVIPRLPENRLDLAPESGLRWIYDAVAAGVPAYLAALEGADDHGRESIPFLLAFLTSDEAAMASAPVLTKLLDDRSERVRASAAIALSHATKFVPALWEQSIARCVQPTELVEVMLRAAGYLARRLGGELRGIDGEPFDADRARARIGSIERELVAGGAVPGTRLALLLF